MAASQRWLILGRPHYVAIACCILSVFEVAALYLVARFRQDYLDFGVLFILVTLLIPITLFYLLPLVSIFTRSRTFIRGVALYALAILALWLLSKFLLNPFLPATVFSGHVGPACSGAAESLEFSARAACLTQFTLAVLLLNAVTWAVPLALLEFLLRQYEMRGHEKVPPTSKNDV